MQTAVEIDAIAAILGLGLAGRIRLGRGRRLAFSGFIGGSLHIERPQTAEAHLVFRLPLGQRQDAADAGVGLSGDEAPSLLGDRVARHRFEMISQRYERGATLITSNLPFDEWTETFGTERLTGALLDRLTHHVNILEMNGESYRLAQSRARKPGDNNN